MTENATHTLSLDKGYARTIIDCAKKYGCLRNQVAYLLATSEWETAHTQQPVREAYWLSESWREQNLRYYPWYGRGFVQLTWKENYEKAQTQLGIAPMLTNDPDAVMDPEIAAEILVRGSMEGWFTGKKLSEYVTILKSDYANARRVINGTDKMSEIADIARDFDVLLLAEGYGVEDETPEVGQSLEDRVAALEARVAALESDESEGVV